MEKAVLKDCVHLAMAGGMTFPETVKRMAETGVERYRADLVSLEKNHYASDGETHREMIPLADAPAIADQFHADEIKAAIADIQQRRIDYPEFLRRVMSGGTTEYTVFIAGRKAIYTGRRGDFHIEQFPAR